MNPAGKVRCHMAAIVKGYSRMSQQFLIARLTAMDNRGPALDSHLPRRHGHVRGYEVGWCCARLAKRNRDLNVPEAPISSVSVTDR